MGPVLALKYFRYTYRSSAINILQQAERSRGSMFSMGGLESQLKSIEKDVASASQNKLRSSVYEPLISDSLTSTRRSIGSASFDFLQSAQSRLSSSYSRNCKDNWIFFFGQVDARWAHAEYMIPIVNSIAATGSRILNYFRMIHTQNQDRAGITSPNHNRSTTFKCCMLIEIKYDDAIVEQYMY